jgi:hypothetical protein
MLLKAKSHIQLSCSKQPSKYLNFSAHCPFCLTVSLPVASVSCQSFCQPLLLIPSAILCFLPSDSLPSFFFLLLFFLPFLLPYFIPLLLPYFILVLLLFIVQPSAFSSCPSASLSSCFSAILSLLSFCHVLPFILLVLLSAFLPLLLSYSLPFLMPFFCPVHPLSSCHSFNLSSCSRTQSSFLCSVSHFTFLIPSYQKIIVTSQFYAL